MESKAFKNLTCEASGNELDVRNADSSHFERPTSVSN